MNPSDIPLGQFLALAGSLFSLAGLIGKWFYDNGKRAALEETIKEKNMEQDEKLEKLFGYKDNHEREASEHRLKYEIELAEMRGQIKGMRESQDGQFVAIMERLTRVENKIDRLEQQRRTD